MMYEGSQIKPSNPKTTISNKDGKAFCVNCGKRQPYNLGMSVETLDRKDIPYTYIHLTAFCSICKEEIYVPEINDANVQARLSSYNEAKRRNLK